LEFVERMALMRAPYGRGGVSVGSHTLDGACWLRASGWRLVHFEFERRLGKRLWGFDS
jgi:hypothetical protein